MIIWVTFLLPMSLMKNELKLVTLVFPKYRTLFLYIQSIILKKKPSFCSIFRTYVLIFSTLAFPFKIIRCILFSAVKNVRIPQSRNIISTNKELFHNQETFPQSRNLSILKEHFHIQGAFPQSRTFSIKKVYLIKDIICKQWSFL